MRCLVSHPPSLVVHVYACSKARPAPPAKTKPLSGRENKEHKPQNQIRGSGVRNRPLSSPHLTCSVYFPLKTPSAQELQKFVMKHFVVESFGLSLSVIYNIPNRKSLGHRPVDPCLSRRVAQGHPAGVPGIFLELMCPFLSRLLLCSNRVTPKRRRTPICGSLWLPEKIFVSFFSEILRRKRSRRGRSGNLSKKTNLRKIAGIPFRTSHKGCAKLSQICRKFESKFQIILCNYPLSNAPSRKIFCGKPTCFIGDKFGESLGGSQAPPSFWEVPGLPRKFPELPRKLFGDFSGSSLTVELNSNPEVPRKFPRGSPEVSQTSPEVPQTSPEVPGLPRRSAPFSGKPDTLSRLTKTFSELCHNRRSWTPKEISCFRIDLESKRAS